MATMLAGILTFFAILTKLSLSSCSVVPPDVKVHWLKEDIRIPVESEALTEALNIFCRHGETKKLVKIWKYVHVQLEINDDDFKLFMGPDQEEVYRKFQDSELSWLSFKKLMPWKTDQVSLELFNKTCLGVYTKADYKLSLHVKGTHMLFVIYLVVGLALFFLAGKLSKNILFYYGSGVSLGLVASLLIIVFILSRYLPKRYGGYAFLIGGWSLVMYLLQVTWINIQNIIEQHSEYVLAYFTVMGLISFAVCYWRGPVTNPRMLTLIQWTIQLLALVFIYNSSQIQEVSLILVLIVLLAYNFPVWILRGIRNSWRRRFPIRIKLISEEEFLRQGTEETRKALDELREYCRSPDCNAWKVISSIRTPTRFAEFVEGSPHVTDTELLDYESDGDALIMMEDSDDASDIDFRLQSH